MFDRLRKVLHMPRTKVRFEPLEIPEPVKSRRAAVKHAEAQSNQVITTSREIRSHADRQLRIIEEARQEETDRRLRLARVDAALSARRARAMQKGVR